MTDIRTMLAHAHVRWLQGITSSLRGASAFGHPVEGCRGRVLRLWAAGASCRAPERLVVSRWGRNAAARGPTDFWVRPRYNPDTLAGPGTSNAAKPPQYEGFSGTPGGTRIPNLLIRSHTPLIPACAAQSRHVVPCMDFSRPPCRHVPPCTCQYHDVGLQSGCRHVCTSKPQDCGPDRSPIGRMNRTQGTNHRRWVVQRRASARSMGLKAVFDGSIYRHQFSSASVSYGRKRSSRMRLMPVMPRCAAQEWRQSGPRGAAAALCRR
jgi:hypothetical protein